MSITGKDLIGWGLKPGKWFSEALASGNRALAEGQDMTSVQALVTAMAPPEIRKIPLQSGVPVHMAIEAETPDEEANVASVTESMEALMRTPTIRGGAVMPDACPVGPKGTIPVGGVAAAEGAIHPGMHSADICCSVAISILGDVDPKAVLDAAQRVTHFGGGARREDARVPLPAGLGERFVANPFLLPAKDVAAQHFATQGDGNHFLFVGRLRSTGEVALVTHHGSRKPGAILYKRGKEVAEKLRRLQSPETLKQNAWIPFDTEDGRAYWDALQVIRDWTKANHFAIHDLTQEAVAARARERFWNEHNFVFRRGKMFLHGKGATPAWGDYAEDASGLVLIPLNMAEPVLIARGTDKAEALGFCPHGAGRNYSRSEHMRRMGAETPAERLARETEGIDARFFSGVPDASELPSAYKPAATVVRQIEQFGLAEVVDYVDPYGCIMAGDWLKPFRERRRAKRRVSAAS
ncbi:MAG: RtcB family protein [Pseudomonadota bacterium]